MPPNHRKVVGANDALGFTDAYDLVYLPPQNTKRVKNAQQNMGYGFVNFKRPEGATAFLEKRPPKFKDH